MIDLGAILRWLQYRKITKRRKITEDILLRINVLTVTIHGRQLLTQVCLDEDSELPYEIRRMYWVLLQSAPIQEYAQWN